MSELTHAISAEVRQFLNDEREYIFRQMSRTAIIYADDSEIEITQSKDISPGDARQIRSQGAGDFTSHEWFNDVRFIEDIEESDQTPKMLRLDAKYPMSYFNEEPRYGSFVFIGEEQKWCDSYGPISSFYSNGQVKSHVVSFVNPESRDTTQLVYPLDSNALEQYNARYQQYLRALNESEPTISYYQGWDQVHRNQDKPRLVIGGLSLQGFGITDVLAVGSPAEKDMVDTVRVVLNHTPEQNGYVGRDIRISKDGEAITEPYWDGEDDVEQASEELLTTALELIQSLQ